MSRISSGKDPSSSNLGMKYLILNSVEEFFGASGYSKADILIFERILTRLMLRFLRISLSESGKELLRNFLKNIID